MKQAPAQIVFALIAIGFSHFGSAASACVCNAHVSPYREYAEARAVFTGKVMGSRDSAGERIFRFTVNESLKGAKSAELEVSVGPVDSDCYQGFTVGESYLVYAFGHSEDSLGSSACERTTNLSYAADDLHYLRDLLRGVPEPRVYGSVMRVDADLEGRTAGRRVTAMEGIKILIEGEGKQFEAVTDKQGLFSLARIPDGRYKAHSLLPEKYTTHFPAEEEFVLSPTGQGSYFRVQQGVTAYVSFRIGWNNNLSGKILDSEGNPIVRARVSLLLVHSPSPLLVAQSPFDSYPGGQYHFIGLTPGRYLLSVNIRAPLTEASEPTFYYPGMQNVGQASEITIGESESLKGRDIKLPQEYVVRRIEGLLVWPNGVPVSGGAVFLSGSKDAVADDQKYDWGGTDVLGRFWLQAFVGREYWVHGESNSSGKGEPFKIKVGKNNEPLKVVIPLPKALRQHDLH